MDCGERMNLPQQLPQYVTIIGSKRLKIHNFMSRELIFIHLKFKINSAHPRTIVSRKFLSRYYLRLKEEYIISLDPPPPPRPQPQTHRALAYRALAHGPQPRELQPR